MKLAVDYVTDPAVGEQLSGDAVVVRREKDLTLVAVIDVLGHGAHAAEVADLAVAHLEGVGLSGEAEGLMQSLHRALRGTRGAAATLCLLENGKLSGCAVGNVELRVQGSAVPVFLNPGILGQQVRRMYSFSADLRTGDRLICFSDGISSHANFDRVRHLAAREACRALFEYHRKDYDDATVVITDVEAIGGREQFRSRRRSYSS